jgi:hypothetical protein
MNRYYIRFYSMYLTFWEVFSTYSNYALLAACTLLPFMVLMRSLVLFGYAANAMPDVCLDKLASLPPAVNGQASSFKAQDAMRLYSIIEKRPCKILLLGYEVQPNDAKKLCLFVVSLQIASSVGVSWLAT